MGNAGLVRRLRQRHIARGNASDQSLEHGRKSIAPVRAMAVRATRWTLLALLLQWAISARTGRALISAKRELRQCRNTGELDSHEHDEHSKQQRQRPQDPKSSASARAARFQCHAAA
jgi:hypothetical protein